MKTAKIKIDYLETPVILEFNAPRVKTSTGNDKIGQVYNLSFVAGPAGGCDPAAPCWREIDPATGLRRCYACHKRFKWPNVYKRLAENAAAWHADPDRFAADLFEQSADYSGYYRYFTSGDIPDRRFLELMVDHARARPDIIFLAFTKKYDIVNGYLADRLEYLENDAGHDFTSAAQTLPANLVIIFSVWPGRPCNNPYNLPTAIVTLKRRTGKRSFELIPDERLQPGAVRCPGGCDNCGHECWRLQPGQQVNFIEHA